MYIVVHTLGGKGAEKHTHYHYWYYSPTHTVGRGGQRNPHQGGTEKCTFKNRGRVTYRDTDIEGRVGRFGGWV